MHQFQRQCIHNGIITENNIIFFRIWRYFSHRASILCLNYIFFLHQHSLCSAACCNPPFPPLQLTPCYWLNRITHFLCNLNSLLLIQRIKHVTTATLGMNEAAVALLAKKGHAKLVHTFIHTFFYIYYSDSLWSLATEHNQLGEKRKKKPLWETFPNALIRRSVQIEWKHLGEDNSALCSRSMYLDAHTYTQQIHYRTSLHVCCMVT